MGKIEERCVTVMAKFRSNIVHSLCVRRKDEHSGRKRFGILQSQASIWHRKDKVGTGVRVVVVSGRASASYTANPRACVMISWTEDKNL